MMARLNEQPTPPDGLEILRRKFLRQNREIAKINSSQSQRIRELENECARQTSYNFELRGQIFHLERELEKLETSSAQRIADHALEVKRKMEAQLTELATLLAGLGVEPPSKRLLPTPRNRLSSSLVSNRSPRKAKPRPTSKEAEELAYQEGRLPPIPEHKPYPRATMNSEETGAICSEAAETPGSPALGSPPASRSVDDEGSSHMGTRNTGAEPEENASQISMPLAEPAILDPGIDTESDRKSTEGAHKKMRANVNCNLKADVSSLVTRQPRTGSKRKLDSETGPAPILSSPNDKQSSSDTEDKRNGHTIGVQVRRNLKGLPSVNRKEAGGKSDAPAGLQVISRTPLGAKSTNNNVMSPKKLGKDLSSVVLGDGKPHDVHDPVSIKPGVESKTSSDVPNDILLPTDSISPPPDIPRSGLHPIPLDMPGSPRARAVARDTPPPTVSSTGEIPRPSRRVRAAISYAEPNLRDKMRRPTKELLDAVAGEGKFIYRSTVQKHDEHTGPFSATKLSLETCSKEHETIRSESRRQSVTDPLVPKTPAFDIISGDPGAEGRRRKSSAKRRESQTTPDRSGPSSSQDASLVGQNIPPAKIVSADRTTDIYDFTTSSPTSEKVILLEEQDDESITVRQPSRRASTLSKNGSAAADLIPAANLYARSAGKKRSSMAAPKRSSLLGLDGVEGAAGDDGRPSAKDRISRRRSMML
ncbi:hypothetical protein VTK73DRAFT_10023 [Phialemonium thermophilum]|uniref:Shugoshin n=1 Tax=Phialemonium thermophilum TaxID=223376 RepID=A0ABR3Y461_9PEZI